MPPEKLQEAIAFPTLVNTNEAARLLNRPPSTLKRWRYEDRGDGPDWIVLGRRTVMYDRAVLLKYLRKKTRIASEADSEE